MTLEDWLHHLESLHPKGQAGIELGLERVQQVKNELGQAQHCPVIIAVSYTHLDVYKGQGQGDASDASTRTGASVPCY